MKIKRVGEFGGKPVEEAELVSATGARVFLMNWGVTVRDWQVPAGHGMRQVVLGFESFDPYPLHSPHFGSLAGRVANRIGFGKFTLEGRTYDLPVNEAPHHLHGGPDGLGRQVWEMEPDARTNRVRFTLHSPDGAMGYPGAVDFVATYQLDGNALDLTLEAMPDRVTPISLVQHQYFNLGTGPDVLDHRLRLDADRRTVSDESLLPTGAIVGVEGTRFDFRHPRNFRGADGAPLDYDLNMILRADRDPAEPAAEVLGPDGALRLRLFTDRPAVQLYNAVWTDVPVPGLGGRMYGKYSGLCLEDQAYPNAVNQPEFPSILNSPDRPYRHHCRIDIAEAG
ncbi:MAG: galactose mutarotase [Hyphomicrobiaceae bacterium]|nr:galactose mutarotase [Hyphomicrobiaceae bacterium]